MFQSDWLLLMTKWENKKTEIEILVKIFSTLVDVNPYSSDTFKKCLCAVVHEHKANLFSSYILYHLFLNIFTSPQRQAVTCAHNPRTKCATIKKTLKEKATGTISILT